MTSESTEASDTETMPLATKQRLIRAAAIVSGILQYFIFISAFGFGGQPIFALLCLAISSLFCTLLHEAGHALAAWAVGWRVIVFAVRPIAVRLPAFSVAFGKLGQGPEYLGWVQTIPASPENDTCRNWSEILAAGPLISLVVAMMAIVSSLTWLKSWDTHYISASTIGFGFSVHTFSTFLFTLLPSWRPGRRTDGDKLRELNEPKYNYHEGRALAWLGTLRSAKVRLRDWPSWLFDEVRLAHADNDEIAKMLDGIRLGRLLDTFEIDRTAARKFIEEYRAKFSADDWLTAIDAYFTSVYDRDPSSACAILAAWPRPATPTPMFIAAEAAVAAVNKKPKEAKDRLREMMKLVRAGSPFRDDTFRDIYRQIRKLAA